MKTEVERLLSHPELEAPDHPYVDTLREMAEDRMNKNSHGVVIRK